MNAGTGRSSNGTRLAFARACSRVQQRAPPRVLVLLAQALLIGAVAGGQRLGPVVVEQVGDHADDAGRVEHVNGGAVVGRGDPHRGVLA